MRALLATHILPWGPSDGGQQRTSLLYEAIASILPVDILQLVEDEADSTESSGRPEILARISWKKPTRAFYKFGVSSLANAWCHSNIDWTRYSLVVGRYLVPMTKVDWPRHVRTLVDCDDAFYRYVPDFSGWAGDLAAGAKGWLRQRLTRKQIQQYDHVFFCSPRDRGSFQCRSSSILPNVVRAPSKLPDVPVSAAPSVLFVGNLKYPPNRYAVAWFLEHCWPAVAAQCPGLALRIVGSAHARDRERWAQVASTELPGFVEDLTLEYARAIFTVVPIHYGGGTCIKFLESAVHHRASVVTNHVYGGFSPDFQDGVSVLVASDARTMIEHCVALFKNHLRRDAIARRAETVATSLYTISRFTNHVQDTVRRLLSGN